jgi:hypothetical protein
MGGDNQEVGRIGCADRATRSYGPEPQERLGHSAGIDLRGER